MKPVNETLEIGVDIGSDNTTQLRFSAGGHSTSVSMAPESATQLAGSLLTACFITSIGQTIPEGTRVAAGQIPVTASTARCDPQTGLPTMTVTLMGGGDLTLVFSADLAISGAAALAQEGVKAAQTINGELAPQT